MSGRYGSIPKVAVSRLGARVDHPGRGGCQRAASGRQSWEDLVDRTGLSWRTVADDYGITPSDPRRGDEGSLTIREILADVVHAYGLKKLVRGSIASPHRWWGDKFPYFAIPRLT